MIFINDNWETVNTFNDALDIIQENLGKEFAEKVKELHECEAYSKSYGNYD